MVYGFLASGLGLSGFWVSHCGNDVNLELTHPNTPTDPWQCARRGARLAAFVSLRLRSGARRHMRRPLFSRGSFRLGLGFEVLWGAGEGLDVQGIIGFNRSHALKQA